ncbi:MAG: hypothetical protein JST32_10010 [Bacteroidetes bacterium]|nr:hypothetical protein [Bacteroidota bacterium]
MQTLDIRQKLHQYIDDGDEKLLKMMFALAKEYNEDDDVDYTFTDEDIKAFDQRKEKRLRGESKTYGWQEAKSMIVSKKPI